MSSTVSVPQVTRRDQIMGAHRFTVTLPRTQRQITVFYNPVCDRLEQAHRLDCDLSTGADGIRYAKTEWRRVGTDLRDQLPAHVRAFVLSECRRQAAAVSR